MGKRVKQGTYEDFLGIAYPPGEVQDVTIGLDDLRCQFHTEPVQHLLEGDPDK